MLPGVRPSIILASSPTATTCLRPLHLGDRHDRGLVQDDAAVTLTVDQGVCRTQVDGHVGGEHAEEA